MSLWSRLFKSKPPDRRHIDNEANRELLEEVNSRLKRVEAARKAADLDSEAVTAVMQSQGVHPGRRVQQPFQSYIWHIVSYACAQRIATAVVMNELKAFRTADDVEVPLARATKRGDFARPNEACTLEEHIEFLVLDLMLSGNSYEYIAKDGLWRINPQRMKIVPGKTRRIDHYEYDAGAGRKVKLDPELIIHRRKPNPVDEYYGIGPGSVALDTVQLDGQMDYYNKRFFEAGQRLGVILETELELSRAKKRQLAREYALQFSGVQNMHKVAVLSHGLTAKEAGESHRDLEFSQGKKDIRDAVCMAYLVPPVLIGITESVNYANARQQLEIFYSFNVLPLMRFIVRGWNDSRVLFPNQDIRLKFDEKEVQDRIIDPDISSRAAVALYQSGLYGRNKLREKFFKDSEVDENELADIRQPMPGSGERPAFSSMNEASVLRAALRNIARENRRAASKNANADDGEDNNEQAGEWKLLEAWDTKGWERLVLKAQGDREADLASRVIVPLLRAQRDKVLQGIKSNKKASKQVVDVDSILAIIDETNPEFSRALEPEVLDMLEEMGSNTFAKLGLDPDTFDVFDPEIVKWAEDRSFQFALDVNDTTKGTVRSVLARGLENGDTLDEIADDLKDTYDQWMGEGDNELSESRAMRIARTETVSAQNHGIQSGFEQSEIVEGKSWMTMGDFKVRDAHVRMDGQTVALDSKFSNGLRYPGDMQAGKASETVNCRCTIQPAVRE